MNRRKFLLTAPVVAAVSLQATLKGRAFSTPAQSATLAPNPCKPTTPDFAKEWKETFPVALWLDPIDEHRKQLEELILFLSKKYDVPTFRPHCTLLSGNLCDLGQGLYDLLESVDMFCSQQGKASLNRNLSKPIDSLDNYEDSWSTFLYLALNADPEAYDVFNRAERILAQAEQKTFWLTAKKDPRRKDQCASLMPHVSLAYAKTPRNDIRDERITTARLPDKLSFGSVKVVMPSADGQNPGNWESIIDPTIPEAARKWIVLYSRLLLGPELSGSRRTQLSTVIAGGQEGTDQIALNAARKAGLTIGGYCPPCRETNRDSNRPPVPRDLPLEETPERNSTNAAGIGDAAPSLLPLQYVPRSQRTEWNCRDSDAVLVIRPTSVSDPGTVWTVRFAKDYGKPICFVDPLANTADDEINKVVEFLNKKKMCGFLTWAAQLALKILKLFLDFLRDCLRRQQDDFSNLTWSGTKRNIVPSHILENQFAEIFVLPAKRSSQVTWTTARGPMVQEWIYPRRPSNSSSSRLQPMALSPGKMAPTILIRFQRAARDLLM